MRCRSGRSAASSGDTNHVSPRRRGHPALRAAAHIGPVEHDGHGFVGTDINLLFRTCSMRGRSRPRWPDPGTELGLIVSGLSWLPQPWSAVTPSLVSPDAFRPQYQTPGRKHTRAPRVDHPLFPEALDRPGTSTVGYGDADTR